MKLGEEIIERILKEKPVDQEYIAIDTPTPPWKEFLPEDSNVKFVIFKYNQNSWAAVGVPKEKESSFTKMSFPENWGGIEEKELRKLSGVKDVLFCHKAGFFATAKTKEGAIELVKKTLELSK